MTKPPEDNPPAVPPYEGRKESADSDDQTYKDGARTGGASAPTTDPEMKSPDPAETERGAVASPADERPAEQTPDGESAEQGTGPAHSAGTTRGEDQS
jgi:hypothetical protein